MYLFQLSNEKRHIFLDLELYMSKIDGKFSEEEKEIINTHCLEMHINNNNYECELPLETVLSRIREEFNRKEKRIVYLELLATVLADNVYDDAEKDLIEKLKETFEIGDDEEVEIIMVLSDIKSAYKKCASFIMGE